MDENIDLYVLGRMAQWAGDFAFALDCFKKIAPVGKYGAMPDAMGGAGEVARFAAALRSRQITQRRAEFKKFNEQNIIHYHDVSLTFQPPILEGDWIRAALWWVEPRRLEVRAFPLSREAAAAILHAAKVAISEFRGLQVEDADRFWIASQSPYTTCDVTPLGMVWCESLWTLRETPMYQQLVDSAQEALMQLDPSLGNRVPVRPA